MVTNKEFFKEYTSKQLQDLMVIKARRGMSHAAHVILCELLRRDSHPLSTNKEFFKK